MMRLKLMIDCILTANISCGPYGKGKKNAPPDLGFPPPGVAAAQTPAVVYGVVDLYGMAVKVTIVHNHNHSDRLRRNNAIMRALSPDVGRPRPSLSLTPEAEGPDRLLFHTNCGQKAAIISDGRTALRPQ